MRHWPRTGAEAPPHLAVQECECGSLFIIFSSQRGGAESNKLFQRSSVFFVFFLSSTHRVTRRAARIKCVPVSSLWEKKKKKRRMNENVGW